MTRLRKDAFIKNFEEYGGTNEEVTEFIEELWEDYCGAYYEGKADGMETMVKLLDSGD